MTLCHGLIAMLLIILLLVLNNQEVKALDPKQSESFSTFMARWMNDEAWLTVTLDIMDMHTRCPVLKGKGRF